MPKKKQDYGKKIQELREMTQEYRKNPDKFTGKDADLFLYELIHIKNMNASEPFQDNEKISYRLLFDDLQGDQNDVIHTEIKKRAMDAFLEINDNLNGEQKQYKIEEAICYSELYKDVLDEVTKINLKVDYEMKQMKENKLNADIRDAINKGNQKILDELKESRKKTGFVNIRNQFQEEGFEKGKMFQACNIILKEINEIEQKKTRTRQDAFLHERDLLLKQSPLFDSYMQITHDINNNPERDLYVEEKMQESLEKTQKQLNEKASVEREEKINLFEQKRKQHVLDMAQEFEKFDEQFHNAEMSYDKKRTNNFGSVMQALGALKDYKWNENYGKNSIYEAYQERYDKGIEKALDTLDTYIQGKSRFAFLRRKLGNERLEQAQQMRELLGEIRNKMQEYRSTVKEHPMETGALMEQDDQKKKCEAEAKLVEDAVPLVQLPIVEPIKNNGNPILFEDFEYEQNNKKSNRENDVKVKSENEGKAGSKKQENEVKEEQKKEIQNEKENPSPKIQQTVPDVPNPRSNELMQQNSDGPKSEESQKDRKFVDIKPVVPVVQNANEKSESVEVSTAEKTDQPNTERRSTVNVPKTSKEDQRAIDTIRKSNTWSGTLQPVRAKTVSYEAVNQNRERITYDKLKSDEIKSEKNQDRKPANWVKIAHNGMKQIKEELEKQQRPYEAEDIYDSKVVSKLQEKRKALPKQK